MSVLVPNRLLFRFEVPIRYRKSPDIDGQLNDWSNEFLLPDFSAMDGDESFGQIYAAWNETGLFVACQVEGRRSDFQCDPKRYWAGDNLRIMTDMRDTRDIKRASRYCQQFFLLPAGGGKNAKSPIAGGARIHRATVHGPVAPLDSVIVAGKRTAKRYTMEAHIPAAVLAGFDPDEHHRIGFYTMLEDVALGQQYLTVGDDLNWFIDPSTWATAVLTRG